MTYVRSGHVSHLLAKTDIMQVSGTLLQSFVGRVCDETERKRFYKAPFCIFINTGVFYGNARDNCLVCQVPAKLSNEPTECR